MDPLSDGEVTKGALAKAQHCQQDQHGRPIAGYMHIGVKQIGDLYGSDQVNGTQTALLVLIHELSHALAFSQNLYAHFRDAAGVKVGVLDDVVSTRNVRGVNMPFITTAASRSASQVHFKCESMVGTPLEFNQRSFFEKRTMLNELMTGEWTPSIAIDLDPYIHW
jgi:hypothetical protein